MFNYMRIACDKCQAVYSIAEKIIGNSGRSVKCAKCDNVWKVYPPATEEDLRPYPLPTEESISNIPSTSNRKNIFLKMLAVILVILMFFMGLFVFSKNLIHYKPLQKFYGYFSIYDISGIRLDKFALDMQGQDAIITGTVINDSSHAKKLPKLRYVLLDRDKKVIFRFTTSDSDEILEPGEKIHVNTKISNISQPAKYLQIDIGNDLDFLLR